MNTEELLNDLLYNKSNKELIDYIKDANESELLHFIASNYNWDNGLGVPKTIIENKNCDLGTALLISVYFCGFRATASYSID